MLKLPIPEIATEFRSVGEKMKGKSVGDRSLVPDSPCPRELILKAEDDMGSKSFGGYGGYRGDRVRYRT